MPKAPSAGQGPSVPVAKDGEKGPCALPRIWGRSFERKFANLLTQRRRARVTLRPGLGTRNARTIGASRGRFLTCISQGNQSAASRALFVPFLYPKLDLCSRENIKEMVRVAPGLNG